MSLVQQGGLDSRDVAKKQEQRMEELFNDELRRLEETHSASAGLLRTTYG